MALAFPRDPRLEMYLNGWRDFSTSIRQTSAITIKRGRANEQGKVAPSTLDLTLHDPNGDFAIDNAMSPWFGYIDRNAPTRLSLRVVNDQLGRTVSNGWGTADTGDTWTHTGAGGSVQNSDFAVNGTAGTHSVPAANAYRLTRLQGVMLRNVRVRSKFTGASSITNVTGGALEPNNPILRATDTPATDYYMARVTIETDESVKVGIITAGGVTVAAAVTVAGLTYTGQTLWTDFLAVGHTLRAKVWAGNAEDEPLGWHVTGHDTTFAAGYVGIRSGVATGNSNTKPIVFSTDEFQVLAPRFAGELTSLDPGWDTTTHIRTSTVKASGILQRLGQGKESLESAPRRYIPTTSNLVSYWPCDDAALVDAAKPVVGTTDITPSSVTTGTLTQNELAPWLGTGLTVVPDTFAASGYMTMTATDWCVDFMWRGPQTVSNAIAVPSVVTSDDSIWSAYCDTSARTVAMKLNPAGGAQVTLGTSALIPALADGRVHHVRIVTAQSGANINWTVYLDGVSVVNGTRNTMTNTPVRRAYLFANNQPVTYGHVAAWGGTGPGITTASAAGFGYPGETAGRRLERMCSEDGITLDYIGDLDDTPAMGPQKPAPRMTLFGDMETIDGGTLGESIGTPGLSYRTLTAITDQDTVATLDFSAGQVAPPLKPKPDDAAARNDITVTRVDGGQYRIQRSTGPMNVRDPGTATGAVGRYDARVTVNAYADTQLPDQAGWLLHLGTVTGVRYPQVTVNLRADGVSAALAATLLGVDLDDRFGATNLSAIKVVRGLDLIARGYTETLKDSTQHALTFNAAPYAPYRIMVWDDTAARWGSDTSSLNTATVSGSPATLSVAVTDGVLWTTNAAYFPMDFMIGGQRMTISAISGSSSPQTFTVSAASVNGVSRTWPAGTPVNVANPVYWARS